MSTIDELMTHTADNPNDDWAIVPWAQQKEKNEADERHVLPGGAMRAEQRPFYRIIPFCMMKRMGEAFREGHQKYSEGVFSSNWKKGQEQFYAEAFDHVIDHLYAWYTHLNDPSLAEMMELPEEDHLGHAAAGIAFLTYGEEMGFFTQAADKDAPNLKVVRDADGEALLVSEPVPAESWVEPASSPEAFDKIFEENPSDEQPLVFSKWLKKGKEALGL